MGLRRITVQPLRAKVLANLSALGAADAVNKRCVGRSKIGLKGATRAKCKKAKGKAQFSDPEVGMRYQAS
jgi:hypothetical protein